ncbi:MAG: HEAT repeat domain-containing protein, partial [Pyrinomonadaceae bacterium]
MKPRTQKRTHFLSLAFARAALAALVALVAFAAVALAQQPPQQQRKRVTPLKTSDAAQGSRVTITSDSNLSDYRAYRSGDRFVVIVPQAEGGGGEGARGRGFEGAQVTRNGNDLVYTFRLAPGASAKVNQRFNRLDVQFTAPKDANAQASSTPAPAATPRVAAEISGLPAQPNANARANANSQTATNASALGAATNRNTSTTNPNDVSPSLTFGASPSPAPSASPPAQPVASPAVATATNDQIAQAQPQPPAPVSAVSSSTGAQTATLGATIQRNWYWIVGALLVVGVGLLIFSRAGEREPAEQPPALRSPAPPTARKVSADTSTAKLEARPPTAATAAPPSAADSSATAAARATGVKGISDEAKKIAGAVALGGTAVAAGSVAGKRAQEEPVAADTERVGEEIGKLFAGEPYDESVVGARDAATRELVASELLAALSSRHPQRNARARAAFLKHGYFNDATRDLQSAEAPARRASSAQALALLHDRAATPHLVAALDDPAPDVRRASVEALASIGDPAALGALEALRWRETSRQVPRTLLQHAVETLKRTAEEEAKKTATVATEETIVAESAATTAEAAPPATDAAQPVTEVAKHETGAAATATEVAQPAGDVESQASEVAPVEAAAPGVG